MSKLWLQFNGAKALGFRAASRADSNAIALLADLPADCGDKHLRIRTKLLQLSAQQLEDSAGPWRWPNLPEVSEEQWQRCRIAAEHCLLGHHDARLEDGGLAARRLSS